MADLFEASFEQAVKAAAEKSGTADFNVTQEEADRLREAFKQEEFRKLFKEYVDDMADPAHRQEQEAYLAQMEREQQVPKSVSLLRPEPGFCMKTHDDAGDKVFINVCHSPDVAEATFTVDPSGGGQQWQIPNNLGPPRMEKDHADVPRLTFDFVVHSATLARAAVQKPFKDMLCKVALEGVDAAVAKFAKKPMKLSTSYHILSKVKCIGGKPAVMSVPKAAAAARDSATASAASKPAPAVSKPSPAPAAPKPAPAPAAPPTTTPVHIKKMLDGLEVPAISFVYRDNFELSNHTQARVATTSSRPKFIVAKIVLPQLSSSKGVDLDVTENQIELEAAGVYKLRERLPFPVVFADAVAKFKKETKTLEVTLPVVPPAHMELPAAPYSDDGDSDLTSDLVQPAVAPAAAKAASPAPAAAKVDVPAPAAAKVDVSAPAAAKTASPAPAAAKVDTPAAAKIDAPVPAAARVDSPAPAAAAPAAAKAASPAPASTKAASPVPAAAKVDAPAAAKVDAPAAVKVDAPAAGKVDVVVPCSYPDHVGFCCAAPHDWRQSDASVTILLQVAYIIPESVVLSDVTATGMRLHFLAHYSHEHATPGSRPRPGAAVRASTPCWYHADFTFAGEVIVSAHRLDVAELNMVIVVKKAAPGVAWSSLLGAVPAPASGAAVTAKGHSGYYYFDSKGNRLPNKWDSFDADKALEEVDAPASRAAPASQVAAPPAVSPPKADPSAPVVVPAALSSLIYELD